MRNRPAMILKMAFRNVLRNRRRSLITTGAMSFALAMMIVYTGLSDGFVWSFEHNAVALNLSRIQIHAPGYREAPSLYKTIPDTFSLLKRLDAEGLPAAPRTFAYALAAAGPVSAGILLRGIDVAREHRVTELDRHVESGSWLDPGDPGGVVIGRRLAHTLHIRCGDEVVIVGQAADGSIANDLFRIRGVLKTVSEEIDRAGFFMTLPAFRNLMSFGPDAHEIAVNPPESMALPDVVRRIRSIAPGLDVEDWRHLAPALAQMLDMTDVSLYLLYLIAYAAVALVILNAMLMAVFERIREFGVMKALGMPPLTVGVVVFLEALFQATGAVLAGTIIGLPAVLYLQTHGIDLSRFGAGAAVAGVAIDPIWRSIVTVQTVVRPMLFLWGITIIAVLYPGLKAALIRPIQAITHH